MAKPRPLSPHLQVYRPQLTSVMSIMHRASGAVLATGSLILVVWLTALAAGDDVFGSVTAALHHPVGQLVLYGYSLALVYHKRRSPFVVGFAHRPRDWTGLSIWLSGALPYRYSYRSIVAFDLGRVWSWYINLQGTAVNLDMDIGAGSVLVRL